MDWTILGVFLASTTALLLTPGPIMAIVVGNTLSRGAAVGLRTVIGIGLGEALLLVILLLSVTYASSRITLLFPWVSLACAIYLLCLAIRTFFASTSSATRSSGGHRPVLDGLLITISSPTALIYYAALFLPFVEGQLSVQTQMLMLASIYMALSLSFDAACVLLASQLHKRTSAGAFRRAHWITASIYLATALAAFTTFLKSMQ